MNTKQKITPSRWFYLLGIIVIIAAPVIFGIFLFSSIMPIMSGLSQMPSTQVIVPGSSDINLSESGKYTIFYEYQSVVGNRVFSTGENLPEIRVSLVSKETSLEIPLSRPAMSMTYEVGGRSGVAVIAFAIEKPGIYELSINRTAHQGPEIVLSIIHESILGNFFGSITGIAIGGVVIFFGSFIAGLVILILTYLKRRRHRTSRVI